VFVILRAGKAIRGRAQLSEWLIRGLVCMRPVFGMAAEHYDAATWESNVAATPAN